MIRKTFVSQEDLRVAIELGWNGPDSSLTMDKIIEAKKKTNSDDRVEPNS